MNIGFFQIKMQIKIFYSWQSDLPNRTNRGFIQTALERAARNIRDDESIKVEPRIERDTEGVPGSPNIAETIFANIDDCHIFVGDVSIINPDSEKRKSPNPNVMLELGYALKKLSFTRIVMVLNKEYGSPEELPFDLKMKRALNYEAQESKEDLSKERNTLTKKLEQALKTIIEEIEKAEKSQAEKKTNPIELIVERKDNNITGQRHDYQLLVKLKNNSNKKIQDYHIDIQFLQEFLKDQKANSSHIITSRSDFRYTFFRLKGKSIGDIYPGDTKVLGHIHYYVDHKKYFDLSHLFKEPIIITLYVEDFKPIILEKPFKELQNF